MNYTTTRESFQWEIIQQLLSAVRRLDFLQDLSLGSREHTQGETLDELHQNLQEVIEMLLEDGEPVLEAEFIGTQNIVVAWTWDIYLFSNLARLLHCLKHWDFTKFDNGVLISRTEASPLQFHRNLISEIPYNPLYNIG
jgi:hypothetical protein